MEKRKMLVAKENFEQNQEDIRQRLEFSFNFIAANKYTLLEFLKEDEIDSYLAIMYVKSFFFMQSNQHLIIRKEIVL
jgi:hypothetical protein